MQLASGVQDAGSSCFQASDIRDYVYRKFWVTGLAGGSTRDLARLDGEGHVNPLFAVSSAPAGHFAVHYDTEPLSGFLLAQAFHEEPSSIANGGGTIEQANRVIGIAKSQFKGWCGSFRDYIVNSGVIFKFFHGEALALSYELQLALIHEEKPVDVATTYTKPWSVCPLLLDGQVSSEAQTEATYKPFDIIDTSNLGDHVGFIDIVSATGPLLRRKASSVLYTESLLMATEVVSASLSRIVGSDIVTFSLLIGLAPVGLLTEVTMDAISSEAVDFATQDAGNHTRQYRMRTSWKLPEMGGSVVVTILAKDHNRRIPVQYNPIALADSLFDLYNTMLAHEGSTEAMAQMAPTKICSTVDQQRCTRAGVAALFRLVKTRIRVDWEHTMLLPAT